jgi:hypothetical protein
MRFKLISGLIVFFGIEAAAALYAQSGGYADPNTGLFYATGQQIRPALAPQNIQPSSIFSGYVRRQGRVKAALPTAAPVHTNVAAKSNTYFQWHDLAEGAFTVPFPRGWQISGGTLRTTRLEPHYVVRAPSPTGGVQMFMDDPRLAMRQLPNQMMPREGQFIPSSWGGHLLDLSFHLAP